LERVQFVGRSALPLAGTEKASTIACRLQGARRLPFLLPREFDMPQPSPSKPAPTAQSGSRARWPEGDAPPTPRRGRSAEAGEPARHHRAAFDHLSARVECLNARLEAARTTLGRERPELFDGVEGAFDGLKGAIRRLRVAWESDKPWLAQPQPVAEPRRRPQAIGRAGSAEPDPWDAETAEALTRVCEIAAQEDHRRALRRPPQPAQPARLSAERMAPSASALDARVAELADRLHHALPRLDVAQWLGPIEARVRQLEQEVATGHTQNGRWPDATRLAGMETRIRELAGLIERTATELGRLDDIDARLREVIAHLKGLSAAAERPQATGAPAQALETLLKSSLAARRQDARTAVGVLKSIHHAVGEIAQRLDQWRHGERTAEAGATGHHNDPDADRDLLLKAYREGARALGQALPEAASDPPGLIPGLRRPARYDWSASTWHWHADD
jgi:hypothetical protein